MVHGVKKKFSRMRVTENVFLQVCVQSKSLQYSVVQNVPRARVMRFFLVRIWRPICIMLSSVLEKDFAREFKIILLLQVVRPGAKGVFLSVEHPQNKSTLNLFL